MSEYCDVTYYSSVKKKKMTFYKPNFISIKLKGTREFDGDLHSDIILAEGYQSLSVESPTDIESAFYLTQDKHFYDKEKTFEVIILDDAKLLQPVVELDVYEVKIKGSTPVEVLVGGAWNDKSNLADIEKLTSLDEEIELSGEFYDLLGTLANYYKDARVLPPFSFLVGVDSFEVVTLSDINFLGVGDGLPELSPTKGVFDKLSDSDVASITMVYNNFLDDHKEKLTDNVKSFYDTLIRLVVKRRARLLASINI